METATDKQLVCFCPKVTKSTCLFFRGLCTGLFLSSFLKSLPHYELAREQVNNSLKQLITLLLLLESVAGNHSVLFPDSLQR